MNTAMQYVNPMLRDKLTDLERAPEDVVGRSECRHSFVIRKTIPLDPHRGELIAPCPYPFCRPLSPHSLLKGKQQHIRAVFPDLKQVRNYLRLNEGLVDAEIANMES